MTALQNFRIALTQAALPTSYNFLYKIASPDTAVFKGFSETVNQAQNAVQHGYKNVELTWTNVNNNTVYQIKRFVDQALAGTRLLYMTVPYNDGTKPSERFIDISGIPYPVDPQPLPIAIFGSGYQSLTLKLNNVTILSNPASFT